MSGTNSPEKKIPASLKDFFQNAETTPVKKQKTLDFTPMSEEKRAEQTKADDDTFNVVDKLYEPPLCAPRLRHRLPNH